MKKKIVSTKQSRGAIGPYIQGKIAGGFLFTSGQLPIHPETGEVPESIEDQTKQVLADFYSDYQGGLGAVYSDMAGQGRIRSI